jgi:uncharacterized protein
VRHALAAGPAPELPAGGPLAAPGGAFVTLRVGGRLRGAMGALEPSAPLARAAAEAAADAATRDPRFAPIAPGELARLEIGVTRIGPSRPLRQPSGIDPTRDAIAVEQGWHRGVLLPSAAAAGGWDGPTYLKMACLHAGLPPGAWAAAGTRVRLFATEELDPGWHRPGGAAPAQPW